MKEVFLNILPYIGTLLIGWLGGIITVYSSSWVKDHFKQKEERRNNVEKFMGKVTDVVATTTASGYKNFPSAETKDRMNKASAQLERLGQKDMASNVRKYVTNWSSYYKLISSITGYYDERTAKELCDELDKLTGKILNSD